MKFTDLLKESVVVGIATMIVGTMVSWAMSGVWPDVELPKDCDTWNKYKVMEWSLFFTGFFAHIGFEYLGINEWYCKNRSV